MACDERTTRKTQQKETEKKDKEFGRKLQKLFFPQEKRNDGKPKQRLWMKKEE